MSQATHQVTPSISEDKKIPPLENGDHLTREEFERRYDATPGLKKAELIEGTVFMAPPVSSQGHGLPHLDLAGLFFFYKISTPGVTSGDNSSIRLDLDNMPQPDLYVMILPTHGGQAKFSDDDYVEGSPELVAEVAASSVSFDLHQKLHVYRKHGVKEYFVWRTRDREFDHFVLRKDEYQRVSHPDGILRSEVFPGLHIDTAALLGNNPSLALQSLQKGIDSTEHQTFIAALRQRASQLGSANTQ
jgi:Uma2 family endonuclease